jgi:hypothetical protein
LRIYTTDPTRDYKAAARTSIEVEFEPLTPGPVGDRIEVVDYDAHIDAYYHQVDLDDPAVLMQAGLEPSEADPRFHQQMVYAVASRTLANFDRALGRRISLRRGSRRERLRILPHAFRGRNAFYDRDLHALLFGYFGADAESVGTNMPEQTVYTCLSHDIIAHEMTHAILDRLKRYFMAFTNADVPAFHEGFADLVALFQHFSFQDLLAAEIGRTRADLRTPTLLLELARQFGYATGEGRSLRSALDGPEPVQLADAVEAHDRGAVLVAAVFDGFLATYGARTRDLILIATDGRGELPPGDLSPYLVRRLAMEAAAIAQDHLDMCIRALDYLPPVDVTFGDYLRALVTADFEVNPDDAGGQRAALIEGFRRRGITPQGVISLAEESLRWPIAEEGLGFTAAQMVVVARYIAAEVAAASRASADPRLYARVDPPQVAAEAETPTKDKPESLGSQMRRVLVEFTSAHRDALYLHPKFGVYIYSVNAAMRAGPAGRPVVELVVQIVQTDRESQRDVLLGGLEVYGGTTLVFSANGRLKYAIAKPLPGPHLTGSFRTEAPARLARQRAFVATLDARDALFPYMSEREKAGRMKARMSLRSLHRGRR